MKINFRQIVGALALILGIYSIYGFSSVSGKSYFVGLIPGYEFVTITYYLLIITSFLHKLAMVIDNLKPRFGFLPVIFLAITVFAIKYSGSTTASSVTDASLETEALYLSVIFIGWPIIDLIDMFILPLRIFKNS